ncbi:mitochondrial inner membrane protease ATP23-like [Gossypium hirsutum]|uniref:Mitochondrial inner membrane protease ATP23 n=1 Tax=Gossypium hirsutum TaxID=3635 RepID=A0ABM3AD92_GOSHI|nr:mitochondrial inner membrane protease ATP23-like [Gossypium hirsutum]
MLVSELFIFTRGVLGVESYDSKTVKSLADLFHWSIWRKLDLRNCAHQACIGIRANHLSGDCHYKRELLRDFMKIRGHEQECMRRKVMGSLSVNPFCSETAAKDAMETVWDICYNDTKPFDRAP